MLGTGEGGGGGGTIKVGVPQGLCIPKFKSDARRITETIKVNDKVNNYHENR